jgi:hypothetical protein
MKKSGSPSVGKIFALCTIVCLVGRLASAQTPQAKGFMQWECGGSIAGTVTAIYLAHLPGKVRKESLVLRYLPSQQNGHAVPAEATRCFGRGQCEKAVKAEIDFQYFSDKRVVGTYRIQFIGGEKDEGKFAVKAHQKFHGTCI